MSQVPLGQAVVGAENASASSLLRRVHGLTGVIVLGGYCVFHVVQGWSVFVARELWVHRVSNFELANAATIIVLIGLGAHACSGALLARAGADDPVATIEPEAAPGLRRLQQVSGAVLLVFMLLHLVHLWPLTRHDPVLARDGYEALRLWLETPSGLAVYVIATTALAFHLGHGLSRVSVSLGLVTTAGGLRAARYVSGGLAIVGWLLVLHWVGHFANGVGLWPITGEEDAMPADLPLDAPTTEGTAP